ncbi:polyprenyl synthetase family protein [Rhodococcus sp. G-MC3]|uniref:polyprenyl synthetase family protein n=1 Tax=Rhodococcus sp. G-MC3 TaxID=3046209 RepID=UPI0024B9E803|nr:polyprenyl synthetase family protein [Rhodococcus sp. G-MC3]MDJ0393072.1 polyprenyl synthetase family protein [Rhodococcus sp. G-MC3]
MNIDDAATPGLDLGTALLRGESSPRVLVETALREFFSTRSEQVAAIGGGYESAVQDLAEFVLRGGKRIRPAFAWSAWLGAGGDATGDRAVATVRACASLELVQACALIHDDIIDASVTRRGFPTLHVGFASRHRAAGWSGSSARFGESAAILLGDLALCWADDMLRESGVDSAAATRVSPVWAAMRTEVLGGQLLDIEAEAGLDESVDAAMRVNRYKTAAYTVERPLHLGGVLADASPELISAYRSFGTDIGLAFQLRDDLLGVFGDPAVTGKPSGDDIREGKRTVLMAVGLESADRGDTAAAAVLRTSLGAADLSDYDIADVRTILTDLGAVDDVERRISALTERALSTLRTSTTAPAAARQLCDMAIAATQRSY